MDMAIFSVLLQGRAVLDAFLCSQVCEWHWQHALSAAFPHGAQSLSPPGTGTVSLLQHREQDSGSNAPHRVGGAEVTGEERESRPCVDCHAFEFMQRALQDLRRTARSLDTRTETLLLRAEKRGLCDCFHAIH
ncbi:NELL2-interacting cell ontogeny regulator 1 isoform X1 [Lonchura striata]